MPSSVNVNVIKNGPLKISGDEISARYCGEPISIEPGKAVYICRCGDSSKQPFCDGSHGRNGFSPEPASATQNDVQIWEGKTIRTVFNSNICMHAANCKPLKELRQRELDGDTNAAAQIASVVLSCPSGALTYEAHEGALPAVAKRPTLDIMEGGEVRVQSGFEINAELPDQQATDRATLCRCGLSKNKPWCDASHTNLEQFR